VQLIRLFPLINKNGQHYIFVPWFQLTPADLQSWTKVVETLSEKDPFGSTSEFSVSNFDISTPSPLFKVVTR